MKPSTQTLSQWSFKACDAQEWLPAVVPGCVHTDLLKNGKIPEPFYGTNEGDMQWIDKKDWEYQTQFDVSPDLMAHSHIELVFTGLDTYADVYLNGDRILSADNMFRTWTADVKNRVKPTGNQLRVHFRSPIQEDLPKLEALGYGLPATNDQSERGELGDKKLSVFARKAPYHYGWDWGPRFVTSGIWREVRLTGWSGVRVTDLFIHQEEVTASAAKMMAICTVESDSAWSGTLQIKTDGLTIKRKVDLAPGLNVVEAPIHMDHPKLWWSRGLGEAHLYEFIATLHSDSEDVLDQRSVKTGLRSIRVVQQPDDKGVSFYFELNGVPVFAKGANHIPNDSFLTEMTYERYKHEIVTAVESNMNMLRVWGGGVYEDEDFYALCDEYGILVWQDFMFACSMYPGDEAFLANVKAEAEENVKRLRNHPCIALWCGNNEIDAAWAHYDEKAGWGWKQQYSHELREKIWADYEKVFHDILPEAVSTFAPGMFYWPSSPIQALTRDETQHAKSNTPRGDIHYWGVWHAVEPFSNYNVNVGRFMSEYGFQSFPELKTVRTYAEETDMQLDSTVMKWHQRSGDGNRLIKEYMDIYYKQPKDFPSFLYMSQVLQAEAIKMAMEGHRRKKPFCMGTLYWQINDCWPVASWSSMDYYGRWKVLQYYAKRSYQDVMVSIGESSDALQVFVISDILTPISGTVRLKLYDFAGTLIQQWSYDASIPANSATVVAAPTVADLLQGQSASEVVLLVELEQGDSVIDSKEHYFVPANQIQLSAPSIQVREVAGSEGTEFVLETDVLAKHVWISTEAEGIFSDNGFDLIPGLPKTVRFLQRKPGQPAFSAAVPGKLAVHSVTDFIEE